MRRTRKRSKAIVTHSPWGDSLEIAVGCDARSSSSSAPSAPATLSVYSDRSVGPGRRQLSRTRPSSPRPRWCGRDPTGQHAGYLEWDAVNRFDRCLSFDLLEFTPRPHAGHFSDVNNQDAKLARDGDFAKAESIAFMDEAIDGELKLFSVADRE